MCFYSKLTHDTRGAQRRKKAGKTSFSSPALFATLVCALLLAACQTSKTTEPPPKILPKDCALESFQESQLTFRTWEDTRPFSPAEESAIKSLGIVSDIVHANQKTYTLPGSNLLKEQLLYDGFRSILPLQSIEGWNILIAAQQFAPDSNFIRSFVFLIEGPNGWQSHLLYPSGIGRGNYLGAYDVNLQMADLNHDGRNEFILTSHRGNQGQQLNVEIIEVVDAQSRLILKRLDIPKLHAYNAEFQQNYIVRIQLKEEVSPILVRRTDIAKQIRLNYDDSGRWIGNTGAPFLYETPGRLQAFSWSCKGAEYNLIYTEQPFKGVADDDTIGHFTSFWVLRPQEPSLPPKNVNTKQLYRELGWHLLANDLKPASGNQVLEYESLLPY